ncbi:Protein GLUTAMINE DUMPER 4 [Striga hermonthica]|uniref:Protein GLUTAMINE DUMPER 4 n=1 Tax=Striga hermonthica TaxID=68872 RepID=A0A9N7RNX0_STRHE|nr:Protein GLUTAMINE DUMPER 4 [Striga hermonthica]
MRTSATLFQPPPISKIPTPEPYAAGTATLAPPAAAYRSPWHSPVPYLFGGLAAILVLIALALLILACSHLRPSDDDGGGSADKDDHGSDGGDPPVYVEKVLVIMAGEVRPTFLAEHAPPSMKKSCSNDGKMIVTSELGKGENDNERRENGSDCAQELQIGQ